MADRSESTGTLASGMVDSLEEARAEDKSETSSSPTMLIRTDPCKGNSKCIEGLNA